MSLGHTSTTQGKPSSRSHSCPAQNEPSRSRLTTSLLSRRSASRLPSTIGVVSSCNCFPLSHSWCRPLRKSWPQLRTPWHGRKTHVAVGSDADDAAAILPSNAPRQNSHNCLSFGRAYLPVTAPPRKRDQPLESLGVAGWPSCIPRSPAISSRAQASR